MSVATASADEIPVSDPRFRPRRYTTEPAAFGKAETIKWREGRTEEESDRIQVSQWQHMYAVRIARQAVRKHGTLKAYAVANDLNYDRLSKVVRGDALMRFEDLAVAERLLGDILGGTL